MRPAGLTPLPLRTAQRHGAVPVCWLTWHSCPNPCCHCGSPTGLCCLLPSCPCLSALSPAAECLPSLTGLCLGPNWPAFGLAADIIGIPAGPCWNCRLVHAPCQPCHCCQPCPAAVSFPASRGSADCRADQPCRPRPLSASQPYEACHIAFCQPRPCRQPRPAADRFSASRGCANAGLSHWPDWPAYAPAAECHWQPSGAVCICRHALAPCRPCPCCQHAPR